MWRELVLLSIQSASAGIVFQQTSVWSGNGTNVGSGWTSQSDASVSGFRSFDNFSLASAATINQASWFGSYLNLDLTGASPNTTDWVVRIYADSAGAPGAALSTTVATAADVTRQTVGTGLFGSNAVTVYEFTADLTAFNAAAGTTYWFSPLSRATNFSPLFSWIEGTGGDGATYQTFFRAGVTTDSFIRPGDRAFTLAAVPEPATLALLGLGLAGLGPSRRKR